MALATRQQAILDARAAHQQASDTVATLQQRLGALQAIAQSPRDVQTRLDAAQAGYRDDLAKWAACGAKGPAPSAPADLATLQAQLAESHAQAEAAAAAAASLRPEIEQAQTAAKEAFRRLGQAIHELLAYEALPPLIRAAQEAALLTNSLREQIAGLAIVAPEYKDLLPGLTQLSGAAIDAVNSTAVGLVPHGAETSRAQWRSAITALFEGEPFALGTAPASRFTAPPRQL